MKKSIAILTVIFVVSCNISAQKNEEDIALKEYFADAEFFLAGEFYADALSDYMQVYRRGYEDNANINYRIGICYLNIQGQKDKSIAYLEKAKKSVSVKYKESSLREKNAPVDVFLFLGNAYRVNNRLTEAIESYRKYKELLPEDEVNLHKYTDKQIEACNIANEFMQNASNIEFVNIGKPINSGNDDFKAVISGDGNTLVYMHKLPFYDAVYYSVKKDGAWSEPENITSQLMSDGNQYVSSVSYDGKTLYLTWEDEFNSDIYVSYFADNRWSVSKPLGQEINSKYWESHASISKDNKTLYFTSNRNGGVGEMDIYVSELTGEGFFGPPRNLSILNTELNEDTPFITPEGDKLYFSSQGFTNMGGYDIFVSEKGANQEWLVPENMGYPVNSTDDDLFYYPLDSKGRALYAQIIEDGFGGTDIYQLSFREKSFTEEETLADKDADTPIVEQPETGKQEIVSEDEGRHEMPEPAVEKEPAEAEKDAQMPGQEIKSVSIKPVFFGFDKTELTPESKAELDKVVELMSSQPVIEIKVTGYADPLGPENYNLLLSQRRAQVVLEYLAARGIKTQRIKTEGKGETGFIAVNTKPDGSDNPAGRKFNRRAELEFMGTDNSVVIIRRIDPVPDNLKIR